jgi:hypothetical protein
LLQSFCYCITIAEHSSFFKCLHISFFFAAISEEKHLESFITQAK